MAKKATSASVKRRSEQLHRQYAQGFANQSRHDRDPVRMERMVAKARQVLAKARKLRGEAGREVEELARQRLALYVQEQQAIAQARLQSDELREVGELGSRANRLMGAFRRGYVGLPRVTRDVEQLEGLVGELEAVRERLRAILALEKKLEVTASLDAVDRQIEALAEEVRAIGEARAGLSIEASSTALGGRANEQLRRWQEQVAGLPRVTVRPAKAAGILDGLRRVLAEITDPMFDALDDRAEHDARRDAITEQLPALGAEAVAIDQAVADAPHTPRSQALAHAANAVFQIYAEEFAGKARKDVSLARLSQLGERLYELEGQLGALEARQSDPDRRRSLNIIRQQLATYDREHLEILNAKAKARGNQPPRDPLAGLLRISDGDG